MTNHKARIEAIKGALDASRLTGNAKNIIDSTNCFSLAHLCDAADRIATALERIAKRLEEI